MSEGVKCKCGQMPLINGVANLEGPGNTMHYRLNAQSVERKTLPGEEAKCRRVLTGRQIIINDSQYKSETQKGLFVFI